MSEGETAKQQIKVIEEGPRGQRPSWDEVFMAQAVLTASRASCFNVQAGTVITQDNRVRSTGYNGAPPGIANSLDRGYCTKEQEGGQDYAEADRNTGLCIGAHAETNALANLPRDNIQGGTIYTTIFPCNDCVKGGILAYGLDRLVFKSSYDSRELPSSMERLVEAGVEVAQLDLSPERFLEIAFNHPAKVFSVWSREEKERIEKIMGVTGR